MNRIFSEEILQPEFPLDGVHLVAASAGTGKTYNIQNVYARLIMEKGRRVSEILVVTFTEAATKELRNRLRTILKELQARYAGRNCEGKDETDITNRNAHADALIKCAAGEPKARARVELALLEFDNAAISTIHGFCLRALKKFPFETGLNFAMEVEDDKGEGVRQLARDWWRTQRDQVPKGANLADLENYVVALNKKTDWTLDDPDETTPQGYLLLRAKELVQQYEAQRLARQTLSYDDILRTLRDALRGPSGEDLAKKLRGEFKAALIDEFQDTDPVQYEIFRRVFLEGGEQLPVYFVGDPKQAIYAFRGGDIYAYLEAVKKVPAERNFCLNQNHRSTPRLIEAVNRIFRDRKDDENGTVQNTFGEAAIDYAEDIQADENKKALQVDGKDDPQPFQFVEVTSPTGKVTEDNRHAVLVQEVVATLNKYRKLAPNGIYRKLAPNDIAILVNANDTATKIRDALRECGVPCVVRNSGNVFAKQSEGYGGSGEAKPWPLTADLFTLFQAMVNPADLKQLKAALVTDFIGVAPEQLLDMKPEELAMWVGEFRELGRLWNTRGLAAALAKLETLSVRADGRNFRERLAAHANGERLLTDCEQLIELCFAAVKQNGPAPETLLEWLTQRVTRGVDEKDAEEYSRELESDHDAVKILTMHSSKGLEFPVVFLPECNVDAKKPAEGKLSSFHDASTLIFTLTQGGHSEEEERKEKLRLLYVAMTRATQRTVVLYSGEVKKPLLSLLDNAVANGAGPGTNGPICWRKVDAADAVESPQYVPDAKNNAKLTNAQEPRIFDPAPTKGSYSALSPGGHHGGDAEKDRDPAGAGDAPVADKTAPRHPVFALPGGTLFGTCVHEILEKLSFQADEAAIAAQSRESLLSYGFAPEQPVSEGEDAPSTLSVVSQMVAKTLAFPVASPAGEAFALREVGWGDRLSEQEFQFASGHACPTCAALAEILRRHWGTDPAKQPFLAACEGWNRPIPKGFLTGFIDLTFRHGDYYYIVDWKTNSLGGEAAAFDASGVREEMASCGYFFQYLLYSVVLHRHLQATLRERYSWERNFGGARYYFVRGIAAGGAAAVFADRPSEELLEELAKALGLNKLQK